MGLHHKDTRRCDTATWRSVFGRITTIKSVEFPTTLTKIGGDAFKDCSNLTELRFNSETAPTVDSGAFTNISSSGKLYCPTGSTGYSSIKPSWVEYCLLLIDSIMKIYEKNGEVKPANQIIIRRDGMNIFCPSEEMILADGWVEYVPPTIEPQPYALSPEEIARDIVLEQYNQRTDIPNQEALDRMVVIMIGVSTLGQVLKQGPSVCITIMCGVQGKSILFLSVSPIKGYCNRMR